MEHEEKHVEKPTPSTVNRINLWFGTTLILVCIVGYLWSVKKESDKSFKEELSTSKEKQFLLKYMLGNQIHFGLTANRKLDIGLYDTLHRKIGTLNSLSNRKKLVFKVDESNCQACIDSIAILLNKIPQNLLKRHTIVLVSSTMYNYLPIFVEKNHLPLNSYLIKDDLLPFIEAEQLKVPYFFVYDQNEGLSHLFIPEKTFPELTIEYFKTLESVLD